MKKVFFYSFFTFVFAFALTGCGKNEPTKRYNNRPEQHTSWYINNVSKGNFDTVVKNAYIPKDISDKEAFRKAVKEALIAQKANIDAAGGVDKVTVNSITVKMSIKYKNSDKPVETSLSMMKTGPESYATIIPQK